MNDLFTPLSDEEYDRLDRFLLDRIDEEADTLDKDEGVLDISELDGLFTALVSGPVASVPSQWLPAVWGDFEPLWEDEEQIREIFSLMMRHMNAIATMLMEQPETFEPIFLERNVDGKTYTIVDEWCDGYRRGVELTQEQWNRGGGEMVPKRRTGAGMHTKAKSWRTSSRPSHRMCGSYMRTGWRVGMNSQMLAARCAAANRGWAAMIPAPVAVGRNTRSAACIEARTPDDDRPPRSLGATPTPGSHPRLETTGQNHNANAALTEGPVFLY